MKTHIAAWTLLVLTLATNTLWSGEVRQASVRSPGRVSMASRSTLHPETLWSNHAGGCQSGGCAAPGCSAPGCSAPSCAAAWEPAGTSLGSCNPCCPCILKRIAAGIGRTLDCLFTCNRCGTSCGGGCSFGPMQSAHGCCLPGLVSVRHQGGCTSGGCTSGGCTSGCVSRGSTMYSMPHDSSIEFKASPIVEPGATNPFVDDQEMHQRIAPPSPPKDARNKKPTSGRMASRLASNPPAVVEVVTREQPPRKIAVKSTDGIKPISAAVVRSTSGDNDKVSAKIKKSSTTRNTSSVVKTSATRAKLQPTPANPLRDE